MLKYYNKRLKLYLPILLVIVCIIYSIQSILLTKVNQVELDRNGFNLIKFSQFNPKHTTSEILRILANEQDGMGETIESDEDSDVEDEDQLNEASTLQERSSESKSSSALGTTKGIWFHWDDWLDTYPANSILNTYKVDNSPCNCSDDMIAFGNVNGYWMESYNKKVLRGMTNVFCNKEIPSKIFVTTDYNYIEIPIKGKKRLGSLLSSDDLSDFKKINQPQLTTKLNTIAIKNLTATKSINNDDFYFDPDYEIMKLTELHQQDKLSPDQMDYLNFLKYANDIVDNSDRYFKYPWIISDVVQGNSHHLAYPFFKRFISIRERQSIIQHLVKAWFQFTESIDIPTWINYGSLLGWAYNGVNMPWDTDVDVQLSIKHLNYLAQHFNNSLIIENPKFGNAKFFLDISPTYIKQGNGRNFIDARFIDINSGLYIDISALSHTNFKPPQEFVNNHEYDKQILVHCKNYNWHSLSEILPIRHTFFEGSSVYIPHNISSILTRKYGKESFSTKLHFHDYNYQPDINLWVPDETCTESPDIEDRFTDASHKKLSLEGACGSKILQDEYRINYNSIQRHNLLDKDIDHPIFKPLDDIGLSRKDAWDYFNDINNGVGNGDWYYEY